MTNNPELQQIPILRSAEAQKILDSLLQKSDSQIAFYRALAFAIERQAVDFYQAEANERGISRHEAKLQLFGEFYGGGIGSDDK